MEEGGQVFSVTRRRAGDGVTVVPVGEIDLATVDAVHAEMDAARAEGRRLVLDLRQVTFIDSAGVRLVVESSRTPGGEFVVVRGPKEVRRVFDLVGLDGRVTMVDEPPGE